MKERQPRKSNRKERRQIAVPFIDNSPEAIERTKKALADFAAAVREDMFRPREPQRPRYFGPLDQKV